MEYWKLVWEALGMLLETSLSEAGKCQPDVSNTASSASLVQSRAPWAQEQFSDAQRLIKRLTSQELILTFVHDPEQRFTANGSGSEFIWERSTSFNPWGGQTT
jgi:hypothetical protein